MKRLPLDIYDEFPKYMRKYLQHNGWHFNKELCTYAIKGMRKVYASTGKEEAIEMVPKAQVDEMLAKNGIKIENNTGYDYIYVFHMAKADFYKSSLQTEQQLCQFTKDYVDDVDAGDGVIMRRWYADCVAKGEVVEWESVLE